MLNKYFNTYKATNEQKLYEGLVVESIQINGVEALYIKRDNLGVDDILREPTISEFNDTHTIEMYDLSDGQGFDEGGFMSKMGFRIDDEGDFLVAISRWEKVVGEVDDELKRPREGDLLYIGDIDSMTGSFLNTLFEITRVTVGAPNKFQIGKNFCYRIMCKTFTPSHENFSTNTSLDDAMNYPDDFTSINDAINLHQTELLVPKGNPFGEI